MTSNDKNLIEENTRLQRTLDKVMCEYNGMIRENARLAQDNERLVKENQRLEERVTEMGWEISPDRQGVGW